MTTEIFQPHQRPVKMPKEGLLQLLAFAQELVENADSMEGSITYGWSDEPGQYDVHAFIRTGNSMGQGGAIVIQGEAPEPAPDVYPTEAAFDAGMARGLAQSAAGETKYLGDFNQHAKPSTYTVTWEREIEADDPVEAADKALDEITRGINDPVAPTLAFEVDGREIDPHNPPLCSVQIFGGSRVDPPELCDRVASHWDEHDEGYCAAHSAREDEGDGI